MMILAAEQTVVFSWAQFLTVVIPLVASSVILPMWNRWMQSRDQKENRKALALVAVNQQVTSAKVDEQAQHIEAIHIATNSMKDQLVAATDAAAFSRGANEERSKAEVKAADLVKDDKAATADELIRSTQDKRKTKGE